MAYERDEKGRFKKGSKGKRGKDNPNWKDNDITLSGARARAKRNFDCPEGKEIHHIDGNPFNNDPSNIECVTRKEHIHKDGRLKMLINYGKTEESRRFASKRMKEYNKERIGREENE